MSAPPSTPAPLVTNDLDALAAPGTECPRCTQVHADVFHPITLCHPKLNLAVAEYTKGSGVLRLKCFICGVTALEVKVAES